MKVAITGHSSGIGQALAKIYEQQGHLVVGLSRRNGYNIRSVPKVAAEIEPCDIFINNAQAGFAQTELLFDVWNKWQDLPKTIIVISTFMTSYPTSVLPGLDMDLYRLQKQTLEEACHQLRGKFKPCKITVVKPGKVDDYETWAKKLVDILNMPGPHIPEITLA